MESSGTLNVVNKYRSPLMGFAALWILFFHMWQPLFTAESPAALFYAENVVKRLGFEGVDIFFLLSGMGMTYAIGKHSLKEYYYRRFKRLALPFLAIASIRAVVEHWGFPAFIQTVTGITFLFVNMYVCLWFVTGIAILYLLFPLYWHAFSRSRSKLLFTAAIIALWYVLSLALIGRLRYDLYGFTNRLPIFFTGVYLGYRAQNGGLRASRRVALCIAAALAAVGLVLSFLCNFRSLAFLLPYSNCCLPDYLTALGLCVLITELFKLIGGAGAFGHGVVKLFSFFGGISLEFYCVQEFLGGKTVNALTGKVPDLAVNLAVLVVVTLSAWLLSRANTLLWCGVDALRRGKQKEAA